MFPVSVIAPNPTMVVYEILFVGIHSILLYLVTPAVHIISYSVFVRKYSNHTV